MKGEKVLRPKAKSVGNVGGTRVRVGTRSFRASRRLGRILCISERPPAMLWAVEFDFYAVRM